MHVWFEEVFNNQSLYHKKKKQKQKKASVTPGSEWKVFVWKRQQALKERRKNATVPMDKTNVMKSRSTHHIELDRGALYSICTKISFNQDL